MNFAWFVHCIPSQYRSRGHHDTDDDNTSAVTIVTVAETILLGPLGQGFKARLYSCRRGVTGPLFQFVIVANKHGDSPASGSLHVTMG